MSVNFDDVKGMTPEGIAEALFKSEPKGPLECRLIADESSMDCYLMFEILITIYMEGLQIIFGDITNTGELNDVLLMQPDMWFKSLGFKINVTTFDQSDKASYDKFYYRIIVRNKLYESFFEIRNAIKNYYFFLNGPHLEEHKKEIVLNKLFAIFNSDDLVFKISFDYYYLPLQNQIRAQRIVDL